MPHESHRVQGESSISVSFPPFRFDLRTDQLWRGASLIPLSHKAGQVLHCLVRRPGALVLKQEILDAVWPNTFVTEGVLKVHVVEIRRALGDTVDDPKYIRTVYGRGYEFLAGGDVSPTRRHEPTGRLLDRQREMDTLAHYFAQSLDGRTGVVFVTGAAGVGKTALLQAFLALVKNHPAVRLIQGRSHGCLSAGEPFFPVLDALNDLFRQPGSESLLEYVRQCAPTWLSQLPWLQSETDRRLLRRSTLGAAPGRMLREFAQLLCHVNSKHVLVFALEDLHWADGATLDLIRFLATGSRDLRLLLIGLVRSDRDWLHRLTLQHVLADLHVHRGDVAAGEAAATHLIEMARRSGETTYERLGLLTLVELDWVRGWSEEARVRLESLLRAAAEDRTPLADWRILHIATCVAGAEGRTREAARLRRQRAAVLSRMSGSIEPGDALRSGLERLANMSLNDLFTGDALFSRIRPASAASI